MIKEFKPALIFIAKFLAIYLIGNTLYGLFVESYGHRPDLITIVVTNHTATLLNMFDFQATTEINPTGPLVYIQKEDQAIISVFEGCNGINVMIVFIAFIIAYKGTLMETIWYALLGLLVVHIVNLTRLSLLFCIALYKPEFFFYFHKYLFTAILYVLVFTLWFIWVRLIHGQKKIESTS